MHDLQDLKIWIGVLIAAAILFLHGAAQSPADEAGIRLPDGFKVVKIADDRIATNIFSMTVNAQGQIVVSGPGYVRILLDSDGDGTIDCSKQFSSMPRQGAQGLWSFGNQLMAVGDGALWRLTDTDGNGVADQQEQCLKNLKTGGEHDSHAIRLGPDGYWYLLVGNGVEFRADRFEITANSPVKAVCGGFMLRMTPDFKYREVVAHGFRNAYDFDFNRQGELFVYDSDGEHDVSLPWYRPTRMFRIQTGDHAGWIQAELETAQLLFRYAAGNRANRSRQPNGSKLLFAQPVSR